jgi:hypothetical protein
MAREVRDEEEGIGWSCVEAYAGLASDGEHKPAAAESPGTVAVVCTPSGGARSVRLELMHGWEQALTDDDLLHRIKADLAST